jgi:hypothetical protein
VFVHCRYLYFDSKAQDFGIASWIRTLHSKARLIDTEDLLVTVIERWGNGLSYLHRIRTGS